MLDIGGFRQTTNIRLRSIHCFSELVCRISSFTFSVEVEIQLDTCVNIFRHGSIKLFQKQVCF